MLKKTLLAIAVVSLLAVTAQAGEIKTEDWHGQATIVFDWLPVGPDIPVFMDIEMFIEILDQDDLAKGFNITQIGASDDWQGCIDVSVKSNFDYKIKANFDRNGDVLDKMWNKQGKKSKQHVWIDPDKGDATFCETINTHQLCVKLENLAIVHLDPKQTVHVGDCSLEVAPQDITYDVDMDP